MKVLMVEPGKIAYVKEIASDLESMQKAVGGFITYYFPFKDSVCIVCKANYCDDNGNTNDVLLNRTIFYGADGQSNVILAGTFFIVGFLEESEEFFTNLPKHLIEKYEKIFKYPEEFLLINDKVISVKNSIQGQEQTDESLKIHTYHQLLSILCKDQEDCFLSAFTDDDLPF